MLGVAVAARCIWCILGVAVAPRCIWCILGVAVAADCILCISGVAVAARCIWCIHSLDRSTFADSSASTAGNVRGDDRGDILHLHEVCHRVPPVSTSFRHLLLHVAAEPGKTQTHIALPLSALSQSVSVSNSYLSSAFYHAGVNVSRLTQCWADVGPPSTTLTQH